VIGFHYQTSDVFVDTMVSSVSEYILLAGSIGLVLNVAKLGHYTGFCKSNRRAVQAGGSPVCNSIVFALLEQKYDV